MRPLPAQQVPKGRRPAVASLASLIPLVLFLLVALAASIVVRRRADAAGGGFVNRYFIGNRALGGFVLAMTTIATYGSVSSFVGGPGQAWQIGFGWVYMAVVQVTALVLLYGIFGKKMALISRKLDAVTVVDVVRAPHGSQSRRGGPRSRWWPSPAPATVPMRSRTCRRSSSCCSSPPPWWPSSSEARSSSRR